MKKILTSLAICGLLFFSCDAPIVEPTLEMITDVEILEMSKSKLDLNAKMILNNPNGFSLDLAKTNMKVYVDEVELATIDQSYDTAMPANDKFEMPINIKMDLDKLYRENPIAAIGKGIQIMSDKKIKVMFKGTIDVGKGVAKISVPIEQEEIVSF